MQYNKLVRDNIPEIIAATGKKVTCKMVKGEELQSYLKDKLVEEVEEFCNAKTNEEKEEEIADIQEVIDAIIKANNLWSSSCEKARKSKANTNGVFNKGIVLLEVEE